MIFCKMCSIYSYNRGHFFVSLYLFSRGIRRRCSSRRAVVAAAGAAGSAFALDQVEVILLHHGRLPALQLTVVTRRDDVQVLPVVLLVGANLEAQNKSDI